MLYLLDSNDPSNPPAARAITSELYGGGPELRLQQELVLGIGGWRLLRALGLEPDVCHLNEGHAAFAVLERARSFATDKGVAFSVALAATRAGNLFTTHTAVPAGFDRFAPALAERYLGRYTEDDLGIPLHDLMALGRQNTDDPAEQFNMAYLALRGSSAVNGVSRLHGVVSRKLFGTLFPRWPEAEVPIQHVTNGIHVPTWDSSAADALWTKAYGQERWRGNPEVIEPDLGRVADTDLWAVRTANRRALVEYVRERMPRELAAAGATSEQVNRASGVLDPNVLTLGFARRFATYKRSTLLLRDQGRLLRILADADRPVQLVIAGKAHPADDVGQAMIAEWVRFSRRPEAEGRVVFVPDYDLLLAEHLGAGRRSLDQHATTPVGGQRHERDEDPRQRGTQPVGTGRVVGGGVHAGSRLGSRRRRGARRRRRLGCQRSRGALRAARASIVPAFYSRDGAGIPAGVDRANARQAWARLTPHFSTDRVVREYTDRYYLPAAAAYRQRAADKGALAARLVAWRTPPVGALAARRGSGRWEWQRERVNTTSWLRWHLDGSTLTPSVSSSSPPPVMTASRARTGWLAVDRWRERIPATSTARAFPHHARLETTRARLVPYHPHARTPLEAPLVLWQQ